jgi:hypothetical protein
MIYGEDYGATAAAGSGTPPSMRYSLSVLDSLTSTSPMRDMAASSSSEDAPYLVACCGVGKAGMLAVLRQRVVSDVVLEVPYEGVCGVWALRQQLEGMGVSAGCGDPLIWAACVAAELAAGLAADLATGLAAS